MRSSTGCKQALEKRRVDCYLTATLKQGERCGIGIQLQTREKVRETMCQEITNMTKARGSGGFVAILWYLWCQTFYPERHIASMCLYATVVTLVVGQGERMSNFKPH